jgi:hypothetical protein
LPNGQGAMLHNRHLLNQSRLYKVTTRKRLASLFGMTPPVFRQVVGMEQPYSKRMKEITRNGKTKTRLIQEPRGQLRVVHTVVKKILSRIEPPGFLFCPVKRRSYVTNAAAHIHAREIRTLDIGNYFQSTPSTRVYWFFGKIMHCQPDVAAILAKLLTVDGHLATGSTVSPILSFYAFYDMWIEIAHIAKVAGCVLTVYMDDITISGDQVLERVMWAVKKCVAKRDLSYHKDRRYTAGFAEVTGVIIKDGCLVVPHRQRKRAYEVRNAITQASDTDAIHLVAVLRGLNQQRFQVEG